MTGSRIFGILVLKMPAGRPNNTPDKFDSETRGAFLLAFERLGEYGPAAAEVGVSYKAVRYWRKKDPEFQAQCDVARHRLCTRLLTELEHRAIKGRVVARTFDKETGDVVSERIQYSDRLLERALLRYMKQFRGVDTKTEDNPEDMHHDEPINLAELNDEQRTLIRKLSASASGGKTA